ncbi:MAG: hydroxymethylpyrimidine/phosphomethylpyrimidine kinase [Betaproteobacteria bacterium]|nr:hydroxymethylpyrimidine/phosphomethylpyrimidine kinase [Betaproteobacteria bacterium]
MPDFHKAPPAVLSFAATDPSSGAGIQADVLTLASMGCHPLSVITAITVQDTSGVEDVLPIDADWVADQARSILEDIPVAAFKIGVLGNAEIVSAIAEVVADYPDIPLILDPVLSSARGDEFANEDTISAIKELLIPQCTVITPNTPELRRLTLDDDEEDGRIETLASRLIDMGCEYVLVTGTHESTPDVINTLFAERGIVRSDNWHRLPGSYHGSGCTLASAIAATVARGLEISEAVREAQDYTWQSLKFGFRPGMGQFIPDRLFWARDDADERNEAALAGAESTPGSVSH